MSVIVKRSWKHLFIKTIRQPLPAASLIISRMRIIIHDDKITLVCPHSNKCNSPSMMAHRHGSISDFCNSVDIRNRNGLLTYEQTRVIKDAYIFRSERGYCK